MRDTADDILLQSAINETICIAPYNPAWPAIFLQKKNRLLDGFSTDLIEVEHIGSTSVPGMDSKPIIDIMASVQSLQIADDLLGSLRDFGYVTPPECNAGLIDRRWLMRHKFGHRTHHLHLVQAGGEGWVRTIKFRNILRSKPDVAKAYLALKTELAATAGTDRDFYVNGKTPFVAATVKRFFYERDSEPSY